MKAKTRTFEIKISAEIAEEFYDYFHSVLEAESTGHVRGSGRFEPDGRYVASESTSLTTPTGESVSAVWTVTWSPDGSLGPIEVTPENGPAGEWRGAVDTIWDKVFTATKNEQKVAAFQRDVFAYFGPVLDGEYYISGWRIAPADQDDEGFMPDERIMYLDHNAKGVDVNHAHLIASARADRIASLLSLFLDIGLYRIPVERRWVLGDGTSERRQLGHMGPRPTTMPKKQQECRAGEYQVGPDAPQDHRLRCPQAIREWFRSFNGLSMTDKKRYEGAAVLYLIARSLGRSAPTVRLSYEVAAVDALTEKHTEREFVDLVTKHCPDADTGFVKQLYGSVRSAHFHSGAMPGGEYEPLSFTAATGRHVIRRTELSYEAHRVVRAVLIVPPGTSMTNLATRRRSLGSSCVPNGKNGALLIIGIPYSPTAG